MALLILAALMATILVGCAAGSGGSSQQSAERQAPKEKADSSEQKAEDPGSSGEQLGHPALGSADAPVVMTEFSDYQ
jgi:protein-disulfide isomerase